MTSIRKSPIRATSKKYKRRKLDTECNIMGSNSESRTANIKEREYTIQTEVNSISARAGPETLISDQILDDLNSVCVKVETDEWCNPAAGFYSACAKSEQVLWVEIHQGSKKQNGLNLICDQSEQTGCLDMDQDGFTSACVKTEQTDGDACVKTEQTSGDVMHQDVTRQAGFNSVCVNRKQSTDSNAYTALNGLRPVFGKTKQSVNPNTQQRYITRNGLSSVCGTGIEKQYINTYTVKDNSVFVKREETKLSNVHQYCALPTIANSVCVQTTQMDHECSLNVLVDSNCGKNESENAAKRTVPLIVKPAKRKLHKLVDLESVQRVKKAETPEKDKTEYSLQEGKISSCMNLEPPDDDNLLYCVECNKKFEGDCPVHGPYNYIQDKEVPEGDPLKADNTLPDGLEIKTSQIFGAGLGVFSKVGLESRTMFGPYRGDIITDNHKSGYCWQIYKEGKASHFVDAQNKANSNWMRYVNCAMTDAGQNLVAIQYKGGIYYCTLKLVLPGEELLTWYGDECARELGLIRDKNLHFRPKYVNREEIYRCVYCKIVFTTAGPFVRHMRRMHGGDKLTYQWRRENDHSYIKTYSKEINPTTNDCKINSISNVQHNKSDISLSVCDKQLTSAILEENNREVCKYTSNINSFMNTNKRIPTGKRVYMCEVCGKAFYHNGNLIAHMRIHTGEKPFSCEVCGKACTHGGNLKAHMRIHTGEKPFSCEVCGKACTHSGNLKAHMRIHTGEREYKCEQCGYACDLSDHLKTHMKLHTREREYKCEVCDYASNKSGTLKRHMKIHTGERPYKCEECGSAYKQSHHLKTHVMIHTGERPYKCEVCGYACSKSGTLKTHMMIHTEERLYKCEVCGYECNHSGTLKTHMRIHTGEREYKCEVCGYACDRRDHLKRHMKIHTREREYKCEECGYASNQSGTLKRHMRVHTGERPYKCEECGYACKHSHHLKTHVMIHTGERPYKCEVCGYACNQSSTLKTHMMIHPGQRLYKCEVCGYECNRSGTLKTHMRIHTGEREYKCEVCGYACNQSGNLMTHMRIHTEERVKV